MWYWHALYGFTVGFIVGAVVVIWMIGRVLEAWHDRRVDEMEDL